MMTNLPQNLLQYHLDGNGGRLTCRNLVCQQGLLLFFSLAGLLYAPAAFKNGKNETESWENVIGTCYMSCVILYVAADIFIKDHINKQKIPDSLSDCLEAPLTLEEYRYQNLMIGFFSIISAIPLSTTALSFSVDIPFPAFFIYVIFILVANTVLHFLPVKLVLEHPVYGALSQGLKRIWDYLLGKKKSVDEIFFEQRKKINQAQRQTLANNISNATEHFLARLTSHPFKIDEDLLNHYLSLKSDEKLTYLISFYTPISQISSNAASASSIVGASIILISCLGYVANPYLVFLQLLKSWWLAAIIAAVPIYFFGILLAYFGEIYGERILRDLMHWGPGIVKLPLELKLYPQYMIPLLAMNAYLIVFCAAAAKEMMTLAFNNRVSPPVMCALNVFAQIGLSILGWYAPLDFEKLLLGYVARYGFNCFDSNAQKVMQIAAQLKDVEADCLRLSHQWIPVNTTDDASVEEEKVLARRNIKQNFPLESWCSSFFDNINKKDRETNVKSPLLGKNNENDSLSRRII